MKQLFPTEDDFIEALKYLRPRTPKEAKVAKDSEPREWSKSELVDLMHDVIDEHDMDDKIKAWVKGENLMDYINYSEHDDDLSAMLKDDDDGATIKFIRAMIKEELQEFFENITNKMQQAQQST